MSAPADRTAVRFLTDRDGVVAGLRSAGADLAALLRDLPPGAGQRPVPGTDWTVGETAAHVVTVVRRSLGDRRRSTSPAHTGVLNAQCLEELTERDPARLADLLDADVATVVDAVLPRFGDDDLPVPFHGGTTARLLTAYGVMLADLVVHRWDVARAVGRDVALPPGPGGLGLQALLELLPVWVDPASTGEVDLVLDVADDGPYRLRLAAGALDVARGDAAGVPRVAASAGDVLLALCGRVPAADPLLARLCAAVLPI